MLNVPGMHIEPRVAATLPSWDTIVANLRAAKKRSVAEVLQEADRQGRIVVQPRCGVGAHEEMRRLLHTLESQAEPELLTLTIDSYTRLKHFRTAAEVLRRSPQDLNGYPLVTHGWRRGAELNGAIETPLQVRHGSPDGRELFAVTLASGITAYEGGGLSYNLPYCKNVPILVSLEAWRQVDTVCGILAGHGVVIDREMFGSLTGVLVPPAVSIAICLLEAYSAAAQGVRCVSIAYPQGGSIYQDVAALRVIRQLVSDYLPASVSAYPVLHTFMGVFPRHRATADALILYAGFTARLGRAVKVVNKTNKEAYGIPDAAANSHGIRTTALAFAKFFDFIEIDEVLVEEEVYWLRREVSELVDPVLSEANGTGGAELSAAIDKAVSDGRLDIPFAASIHARSEVVPKRDMTGAIRYLHPGSLPFSRATRRRNDQCLGAAREVLEGRLVEAISADINYFVAFEPQLTAMEGAGR